VDWYQSTKTDTGKKFETKIKTTVGTVLKKLPLKKTIRFAMQLGENSVSSSPSTIEDYIMTRNNVEIVKKNIEKKRNIFDILIFCKL
jgi:hypothetical protein